MVNSDVNYSWAFHNCITLIKIFYFTLPIELNLVPASMISALGREVTASKSFEELRKITFPYVL